MAAIIAIYFLDFLLFIVSFCIKNKDKVAEEKAKISLRLFTTVILCMDSIFLLPEAIYIGKFYFALSILSAICWAIYAYMLWDKIKKTK